MLPPLVALALLGAAGPGTGPARAGVIDAPCFGAASRVPGTPCVNPGLRHVVLPAPADVGAVPQANCTVRFRSRALFVCGWGAPPVPTGRTLALVGDSHAAHWRPAVEALARQEGWRAVSMSHAGCPLTLARPVLPTAARRRGCARWNHAVQRWLRAHPEVSVIVVAQHRVRVLPHGLSAGAGYAAAWRQVLSRRGRHVILLRDTPRARAGTLACVGAAVAAGRAPGPACALPRSYALPPDPAARAAAAMHEPRVQLLDFSDVFCGPAVCLPVIGGALVHRDTEHMNRQFVRTLGPLLIAAVDRLRRGWRDPVRRAGPAAQEHGVPGLPGAPSPLE